MTLNLQNFSKIVFFTAKKKLVLGFFELFIQFMLILLV